MLIDTHAHLDMSQFNQDRDQIIERAITNGVERIFTMGCDISSSEIAIELAQRFPQVYAGVGFHPHDASKMNDSAFAKLRELSGKPKVVAIGEIGLDFYRDRSPRPVQIEVFKKQLALAAETGLPVIVHDREAHEHVLSILRDWSAKRRQSDPSNLLGIIHCFSGNVSMATECISLGFLISIAGPVTYPNSPGLVNVVQQIPLESLLVETDCPYLAPQAHRGKRNEPAYVREVAEEIARIKGIPLEKVAEATSRNAISLFRLQSD